MHCCFLLDNLNHLFIPTIWSQKKMYRKQYEINKGYITKKYMNFKYVCSSRSCSVSSWLSCWYSQTKEGKRNWKTKIIIHIEIHTEKRGVTKTKYICTAAIFSGWRSIHEKICLRSLVLPETSSCFNAKVGQRQSLSWYASTKASLINVRHGHGQFIK